MVMISCERLSVDHLQYVPLYQSAVQSPPPPHPSLEQSHPTPHANDISPKRQLRAPPSRYLLDKPSPAHPAPAPAPAPPPCLKRPFPLSKRRSITKVWAATCRCTSI